jgi:hypothetical protein
VGRLSLIEKAPRYVHLYVMDESCDEMTIEFRHASPARFECRNEADILLAILRKKLDPNVYAAFLDLIAEEVPIEPRTESIYVDKEVTRKLWVSLPGHPCDGLQGEFLYHDVDKQRITLWINGQAYEFAQEELR